MTGLMDGASMIPGAEGSQAPSPFGSPDGTNRIQLDLSAVSTGFELVPEGEYLAYVKTLAESRSKRSGNPMIVVEYAIAEGEFEGKTPGKSYMALVQAALFKLKEFAEATGLLDENGQIDFTPEDAIGRLVTLTVVHSEVESDGKTRVYANPGTVSPPPQGAGAVYEAPQEGIPT